MRCALSYVPFRNPYVYPLQIHWFTLDFATRSVFRWKRCITHILHRKKSGTYLSNGRSRYGHVKTVRAPQSPVWGKQRRHDCVTWCGAKVAVNLERRCLSFRDFFYSFPYGTDWSCHGWLGRKIITCISRWKFLKKAYL